MPKGSTELIPKGFSDLSFYIYLCSETSNELELLQLARINTWKTRGQI